MSSKPLASGTPEKWGRIGDLVAGISALLFQVTRGVKGCLHSKGLHRFRDAASAVLPLSPAQLEAALLSLDTVSTNVGNDLSRNKQKNRKDGKKISKATTSSKVVKSDQSNLESVITDVSVDSPALVYAAGSVVKATFARLMRHLHPTNSAEMWVALLELARSTHGSAKVALAMYRDKKLSSKSTHVTQCAKLSWLCVGEMLLFAITHSDGEGLAMRR